MQTLFDSAGLAIVAYAEVLADGTSPNTNSGITTSRLSAGLYALILPADKAQAAARDLIIVQPKGTITTVPFSSKVDDASSTVKQVAIYGGSPLTTFADSDFTVIILRTIIPPPAGAPA